MYVLHKNKINQYAVNRIQNFTYAFTKKFNSMNYLRVLNIVGLFYMVRNNFRSAIFTMNDNNNYLIRLRKDVSFLNKPIIKKKMEDVPKNAFVIIDTSRADFIDKDIIEEINNFLCHTHLKNIQVEIKKNVHNPLHLLINEPRILSK